MKNVLTKLYIIGWIALTVFFMIIIWKVTFAHIIEEYHSRKEAIEIAKIKKELQEEKKTRFEKLIVESEEKVKLYLGYKIIEEQRIKGHFHHIGFEIGPDKRSHCIMCHGDMPHDDVKELRAFLNMHSFFISCQTCHIKLEGPKKTGTYKWYDRTTGEIVESPVKKFSKPGTYKAKIVPFENVDGKPQRIDSQEQLDFAREYREKEKTLTEQQRSRAKKLIHEMVSKEPYICENCHQKEAPLLPFAELGYPKERVDALASTEVVGMIKNYTQFYIPRMLHPGEEKKKEEK